MKRFLSNILPTVLLSPVKWYRTTEAAACRRETIKVLMVLSLAGPCAPSAQLIP